MSEPIKLENLVSSLVQTAPPGELSGVKQDLSAILGHNNDHLINNSIESYVNHKGGIFSGKYIASKLNKLPGSTKYVDYVEKKLFNIDLKTYQAIDIEDYTSDTTLPSYFDELSQLLEVYGSDHYPSTYAFTVIPKSPDELYIILIGQRLNNENYYTGQWNSTYVVKNGVIKGDVKVDIHYYEDGNVRLNFDETVEEPMTAASAKAIVNFINASENKITLKIVDNFNELNQKYFKNLRRLLPVTRAKIHWGNAIGNYRLGSDVVNKQ